MSGKDMRRSRGLGKPDTGAHMAQNIINAEEVTWNRTGEPGSGSGKVLSGPAETAVTTEAGVRKVIKQQTKKGKTMSKKNARFLLRFLCLLVISNVGLATFLWAGQAFAADSKYPAKAVDLICPFAPGGTTDMWARITADFLKKKWGVPVNVVNKTGGGGVPGNLEVYKATPDGYTMLVDNQSSCSFLEVSIKDLPFKVMDRTFVAVMAVTPSMVLTSTKNPWKTMKDVEMECKRDPANFTWISTGSAGASDVFWRQFFKAIGVDVNKTKPVITRGVGEGNPMAAGGHVKMASDAAPSAHSFVTGGMLRAVAITGYRMPDLYPDTLTTAEQGYPTVNNVWWWGISGPPKLPADVEKKWEDTLLELSKDPEYVSKITKSGGVISFQNAAQFRQRVKKEMDEAADLWATK
jgi:tripartite-type tricarboxylate transporter receptor subunit TctC